MNIALLSEKYTPDIGGLAISAGRLARLLSAAGHDVRVFAPTLGLRPSETRRLTSEGVRVTRFGAHKRVDDTLVNWFELLVAEHRREPFDVLHAYFLVQAGFVAAFAGRYLNLPSVVSIRGNDIERAPFDPSRFGHVKFALQNASAVTTNAGELARKARVLVDREVIVVPNGVDTSLFKPVPKNRALATALQLNDASGREVPVLGFVGELRAKKGLQTLLDSYTAINRRTPSALLIVGEVRPGTDREALDEFLASGEEARIVETGYIARTDLPEYFSLIDIHLHPSLRDGMPNAVLEAMACGRAVVATPVGGIAEVIENGRNGLLVPVDEPERLAETVSYLVDNPTKRAQLGSAARQSMVDHFTEDRELQANLDVYETLGLGD